ncbi:MAG: hypothetical protein ACT4TC_08650 [Myxococcaceae bacterium]
MPSRADAQGLAQRLHALSDAQLIRNAAARTLKEMDPLDATELIHHLIALARGGFEPANCILGHFVSALMLEAADLPHAAKLRRLASVQDLEAVAALFPDAAPLQQMDPKAAVRADKRAFTETLGHLKTKARATRDPDELSRLATALDPTVMRNVLLNPRLTEDLVVRIAARRPARPEQLLEIWRSPRWSVRHAVRRALVFNPYFPPELAAKIVPLLNLTDLNELATEGSAHPILREQAKLLIQASEKRG